MFLKVVWILFNLIVSVGICSIPIIAFGWIDRDKEFVSRISRFWANWMIWSTGIQYDIIGLENIQNRILLQMPENKKKELASHTIMNNYSIENLHKKLDDFYNKYLFK